MLSSHPMFPIFFLAVSLFMLHLPLFLQCLLTVCRARVLNSLSKLLTSGSIVCPLIITCCLVSTHNCEHCLPLSTFIFPKLFGRWILQKFILFSPFSRSDVISQLQKTSSHLCLSVSVWFKKWPITAHFCVGCLHHSWSSSVASY